MPTPEHPRHADSPRSPDPSGSFVVTSWNIRHGGGAQRMGAIALEILATTPDLVLLTECRRTTLGQIAAALADHGLNHRAESMPPDAGNGTFLAGRCRVEQVGPAPPGVPPGRWLHARVPDLDLEVLGVHIPDASRPTERAACWQGVLAAARASPGSPLLIVGDLNTGRHMQDEPGRTFTSTAMLGQLASLGYVDGWRHLHPGEREFSWFSHAGRGFRIDHALCAPALRGRLVDARYVHHVRRDGLSDHAALTVTLRMSPRA